tara:strand:- start:231 stop:365 length:135 start_codon:yes stop_codon:yes gene_type:complete
VITWENESYLGDAAVDIVTRLRTIVSKGRLGIPEQNLRLERLWN